MFNKWDKGIQEDFNFMTKELGRECLVYPRDDVLTYEGQQGTDSGLEPGVPEIICMQELDSEHEVVASGEFAVADVRFTFQSDTVAAEEGYVSSDEGVTMYKILKLTKVKNMSNDVIISVKGSGRKVPNR